MQACSGGTTRPIRSVTVVQDTVAHGLAGSTSRALLAQGWPRLASETAPGGWKQRGCCYLQASKEGLSMAPRVVLAIQKGGKWRGKQSLTEMLLFNADSRGKPKHLGLWLSRTWMSMDGGC